MAITYLGSVTVGAVNIGVGLAMTELVTAQARLTARIGEATALIAGLTANLGALVALNIPTLAGFLAALNAAVTGAAAIIAQIPTASIGAQADLNAQISAAAALKVTLEAELALLVALVGTLNAAIAAGGIHAWVYTGQAGLLGDAVQGVTAAGLPGGTGPTQSCNALVLACSDPTAWASLSVVIATS